MAIPSRIIALHGERATVEAFCKQREVSLILLQEAVAIGDYLLVQAGGFASERVERDAALETLRTLNELFGSATEHASS